MLNLDKPPLVLRHTISTMCILSGLTVRCNIIDQVRPICAAVSQRPKILVKEERFATPELHGDYVCGIGVIDLEYGSGVLAFVAQRIRNDMTLIGVWASSGWKEAVCVTFGPTDISYINWWHCLTANQRWNHIRAR